MVRSTSRQNEEEDNSRINNNNIGTKAENVLVFGMEGFKNSL